MSVLAIRNYALITTAYWGFTVTDGALRMLVLLHFHTLGYSPIQIAFLFLFYEFFGVVTNLFGGWIGAQTGLRFTLLVGLGLQVAALFMLAQLNPEWSIAASVTFVMTAQALSGIAKDLTKMSSKSAIKWIVSEGAHGTLFRWVSFLTGSKNALKGAGFFLGGILLASLGFERALYAMAVALAAVWVASYLLLPATLGSGQIKIRLHKILSKSTDLNLLSAARFFLFGSRDIWFVVGLPLFLSATLGWSHPQVGGFLAAWVIGYGVVQALAPHFIGRRAAPRGHTALVWVLLLLCIPLLMVLMLPILPVTYVVLGGLALYGFVFAINSATHSYLVLAYSDRDKVSLDVGFYYMANAGGRLAGTLLSGICYQLYGLEGCLLGSLVFLIVAALFSQRLARHDAARGLV